MENHDGSGWNAQSEMTYNGLGTRLTTSALGITTQYASDGQLPLTISSGGNTTTILYGLGAVAEKMDEWNFVLTDGFNLPRQLTGIDSEITMSVRYNPWGKPIETDGIGNFEASFIGTLIDATTGLIYVGNGQYYDPETGRFLTRGVNPNRTNPYVPFDPTGFLIAPLGLMAVYYGSRKSKKSAPYAMLLVLMVVLPVSVGLACAGTATPTAAPPPAPASPSPDVNPTGTIAPEPVAGPSVMPSGTATNPVDQPEGSNCENGECTSTPGPIQNVILVGGIGANITSASPAYANLRPLSPYSDWANSRGFPVIPINYLGTKVAQRDQIISHMNQGKSYIVIGHSAGADSTILTLNDSRTQSISISASVLLDPTLTASGVGAENDQISALYENIAGPKVLLAGTEMGIGMTYLSKYVEPKYRYGTSSNPSIKYNSLSDWSAYPEVTQHTAMAIDPFVSNVVISWLEGLGL